MDSVSKVCHKCHQEKPYSEFSKNRARPDGYQHWCKRCRYEHDKMKYQTDEHHREVKRRISNKWKKKVGYKSKYEGAEIGRIRSKKYRDSHPGWNAAQQQKRKALKMGNGGTYTTQEFQELCDKYRNQCLACGRQVKLEADHIVPLIRGGRNDISNIQPLCRHCNSSKKSKIIDYRNPFVAMAT